MLVIHDEHEVEREEDERGGPCVTPFELFIRSRHRGGVYVRPVMPEPKRGTPPEGPGWSYYPG